MVIAVVFDCNAKLIECDNLEISMFPKLLTEFTDWLYEDTGEGYLDVKKSLNIEVLDINVVLRFFKENYPDYNARVINDYVAVEDVGEEMSVIAL
jgi:hypothetical protein